jgi:membrane protein YdbS with pleckstrin-like domain
MANFNLNGVPFKPSHKAVLSFLFPYLLVSVSFYVIILMLENALSPLGSFGLSNIVGALILLILFIIAVYHEVKRHYTEYRIDNNGINLNVGIINKRETKIPYRNIQNIFVERHLPDRLLNIGNIIIETASLLKEDREKFELHGIEEVDLLAEKIIALTKQQEEKAKLSEDENKKEIDGIKNEILKIKNEVKDIKEAIEGFGQHVETHNQEFNYIKSEIERLDSSLKTLATRIDIITTEKEAIKEEKRSSVKRVKSSTRSKNESK